MSESDQAHQYSLFIQSSYIHHAQCVHICTCDGIYRSRVKPKISAQSAVAVSNASLRPYD